MAIDSSWQVEWYASKSVPVSRLIDDEWKAEWSVQESVLDLAMKDLMLLTQMVDEPGVVTKKLEQMDALWREDLEWSYRRNPWVKVDKEKRKWHRTSRHIIVD